MIELYIENQSVDINEAFSSLLTFAIDDVKDFGAKNTSFSKTIILPGTKKNNIVFGHIFQINRSTQYLALLPNIGYNYNAAVSAKAIIFSDNIQVFKGVLRLMEIIIDNGAVEYEVAVFGELGGFIAALGNKKLEDLDFSMYDQTYSLSNIVNSWDVALGAGVYYPLLDYGTYSVNKHDWSYRTFRPALHAKEYIDKIFQNSNYTYVCSLFSTDRFKSLIVPHNAKRLTKVSSIGFNVSTITQQIIEQATPPSISSIVLPIDFEVQTTLGLFTEYMGSSSKYQYTGSVSAAATFKLTVDGAYYNFLYGNFKVYLQIGSSIVEYFIPEKERYGLELLNIELNLSVSLNTNDFVQAFAVADDGLQYFYLEINTASLVCVLANPVPVPLGLGENIIINDTLPKNILQKDFFSSIVKLFNLYVYEDKNEFRQLRISPFVDFYSSDPTTFIDWTDKIDRSKPISLKPMSELNARYYEFKYKADSDFYNEAYKKRYNENYGDRIFDTGFEFANEKETVEIIFSGTPLVGYPSEDKIYSTIFKSSNTVEENIDSNIRLLIRKKITGVSSWDIKDGVTVLGAYDKYGYAGHLDDPDAPANDLNFGVPKELFFALATGALNVNQFNVYYSTYMAEITDVDSKLMTATLRLKRKDINDLDFSRFIWIDGSLFRINKIIDYNATNEDTCKGEFLKVLNTIY